MKSFKKLRCHPNKKSRKNTCLDDETIFLLKKIWNKRHPDLKINESSSDKIWIELKNNLKECHHEICWIENIISDPISKKKIKKIYYAPFAPLSWNKNKNEWLSSVDISKVLEQYKQTYSDFTFLGPSPIDFDKKIKGDVCVWPELCNLNIQSYYNKGIRKIGIVFNLDTHDKGGSHWVGLFINLNEKYIFYFDSTGPKKEPPEIKAFMDRIIEQEKNNNRNLKKYINTYEHQYGTTECGIYVLYFIISLLEKKKPKYFTSRRITDKEMEKFRNVFFNLEN